MTYIIAEISASHNGSLDNAMRLVQEAAMAGANAVKFQTFDPQQMVGSPGYEIQSGPWMGWKLLDLYQKAHTPREWHPRLFDYAEELGLEAFSTPFQPNDVDFLEGIGCPRYKVASFEIIHYPLLERISKTHKPVIISTGMATEEEIWRACALAHMGTNDVTLLHCVSEYPTTKTQVNLSTMRRLREHNTKVGISDHSHGYLVPVMAAAMGACMVEKHIGLSHEGLDGGFCMLPHEFSEMVSKVREAEAIIGKPTFAKETSSSLLRPSLYYAQDLQAGTMLEASHIQVARPSLGLHPINLQSIIGTKLTEPVSRGMPVANTQ